ncbi:MAG: hypothetical protein K2H09_05415 [Treponemataceae bacterium]|nr:hypothetical protein [Treponemataceae bacterium]
MKNRFSASFNGITLLANDEKPAAVQFGSTEKPVSLISWNRPTPLSCELHFTEGVSLAFTLSNNTALARLSVSAELPPEASALRVPYSLSSGASVQQAEASRLHILTDKNVWELTAAEIARGALTFTPQNPGAVYAYFDSDKTFTFAAAASMSAATETAYISAVDHLKKHLTSAFAQHPAADGESAEQTVVSYVAAMAERGKFNEAVETVPAEFKKSSARTYFSAPYFDTLVEMSKSLQSQMQDFEAAVKDAAAAKTNGVFSIRNIADYMCMNPNSAAVRAVLGAAAGADYSDASVADAASILDCYVELHNKNEALAEILLPAAEKCVSAIERACELDDKNVVLSEKGAFIPVIQAAEAGSALLRYGRLVQEQKYVTGGRLIITSCLRESASFDLRTMGELYPIIVRNNPFYPHYEILAFDNGRAVWTWTCAESVRYENDNAGTITLSVDFPASQTHYLIISGINPFSSIYIYDLAFRTDPRFETYNSSGYVYQQNTRTLLLKSRHRSVTETIRLMYTQSAADRANAIVETDVTRQ